MAGQNQDQDFATASTRLQEFTTAINERLIVSSIREQELREVAERLNLQLTAEIADRKHAEDALRESEGRFRALVTASSEVVYRMSPDWTEMRQLHGRDFVADMDEPSRSWVEQYIPVEDRAGVLACITEAIRTRSIFEMEHRVIGKDGAIGWTWSRAIPLIDGEGQILEWFGAASDITERKQAEESVRASAERLRFMAESMPQKIFTARPDGAIDYFNQQWMEFTGLSFEQIEGWGWQQFIHPDDVEETLRRWKSSVATGEYYEQEHRFRRHDETFRWHLSRAHPMHDASGKVLMWIGSNTDVDQARRTLEELARASRAKDDFLATLSHELRTPLTPVLMTAAALEHDPTLSPDLRGQLGMMRRNIELEARLIDDLLDLTRINNGKLRIAPIATDVHKLLEETREIVRDDGVQKAVRFVFQLKATQHHAMGDPTRLQQVFWNIFKNAFKFTAPDGCVTVTTSNDAAGKMVVTIADTGIGIRAEVLPQIFNAFEQGEISFQHRFGGLGLGLAISKAIVELHGGEIHAESPGVGHGSTFTVTLTTVEAPRDGALDLRETPALDRSLRLLVVEDHEATLAVLTRLLQARGHKVTAASSVRNGLAAAANGSFDLVISDLGLPDGTGFELMQSLRDDYGLTGIALSGYGMDDDLRRSHDAGFRAHLTKPIDFGQLQRALEDLMALS
jgi:PAS domain S-box-containing protein